VIGTIVNMLRLLDGGGILPFDRRREFLTQGRCELWIMSRLLDA